MPRELLGQLTGGLLNRLGPQLAQYAEGSSMPNYRDRLSSVQDTLMADDPNPFNPGQQQLVGGQEAVSEALKQALIRRAQENLMEMERERMARGQGMQGIGQLLSRVGSDPRTEQILMDRGVLTQGGLDKERGIRGRMQELQGMPQGQGVQGTLEHLGGAESLQAQPADVQQGLDSVTSPDLKQRLIDIIGGTADPGYARDLWARTGARYR